MRIIDGLKQRDSFLYLPQVKKAKMRVVFWGSGISSYHMRFLIRTMPCSLHLLVIVLLTALILHLIATQTTWATSNLLAVLLPRLCMIINCLTVTLLALFTSICLDLLLNTLTWRVRTMLSIKAWSFYLKILWRIWDMMHFSLQK